MFNFIRVLLVCTAILGGGEASARGGSSYGEQEPPESTPLAKRYQSEPFQLKTNDGEVTATKVAYTRGVSSQEVFDTIPKNFRPAFAAECDAYRQNEKAQGRDWSYESMWDPERGVLCLGTVLGLQPSLWRTYFTYGKWNTHKSFLFIKTQSL